LKFMAIRFEKVPNHKSQNNNSMCGAIIRSRRARLSAKTVEALLFRMENNAD